MKNVPHLLLLLLLSISTFAQSVKQCNIWSSSNSVCNNKEELLFTNTDKEIQTFSWFKNGELIQTSKEPSLKIKISGIYSVTANYVGFQLSSGNIEIIENCNEVVSTNSQKEKPDDERTNFLLWFDDKNRNIENNSTAPNSTSGLPQLTCENPVICGSNTSASLVITNAEPSYQYTWQTSTYETGTYSTISGASSSTYSATTIAYYRVLITDGSTTITLGPIYVSNKAYGYLSDLNDNYYATASVSAGQVAHMKVKLFGLAPWRVSYYDGSSDIKSVLVTSSPYYLDYPINQNRIFSLGSINNNCGSGYSGNKGSMIVSADPTTSINLQTPSNTNACAGGSINLPYTTTGTWTSQRLIAIEMQDLNNNYVTNTYKSGFTTSPMVYSIPSSVPIGTYKIRAYVSAPYISGIKVSSYTINITSTGCTSAAAVTVQNSNEVCNYANLTASPCCSNNGYSYQWYKDGASIPGANYSSYSAYNTGNYSVNITNSSGYNSTSNTVPITITGFVAKISSPNPVLCGGNTSATLTASPNGAGYTYQWYLINSSNGVSELISGANNSTYTTSIVGSYQVIIGNGICTSTSNNFFVSAGPVAYITDLNDNIYSVIGSGVNQPTQLKVHLYGIAPWTFNYFDGSNYRTITTSTSPYYLSVTPDQNRSYSLSSLSHSCTSSGGAITTGEVRVIVDNSTSFSFNTTGTIYACAGGTIDVHYSTTGTWVTERKISLELNDVSGNYISSLNGSTSGYFSNPMTFQIPSNLPTGNYKIRAYVNLPLLLNSYLSPFTINVNNTGCTPSAIFTASPSNVSCNMVTLNAKPCCVSNGFSYQWYKDGNLIANASNNYYNATQTGNYSVRVMNTSTGYNSLSSQLPITINGFIPSISSANPVICGTNTSAVLEANSNASNPTYQWLFSSTGGNYTLIVGANAQTYTATQIGYYKVLIAQNGCESTSSSFQITNIPSGNISTIGGVTNTTISSTPGQSVQLKLNLFGASPWVVSYYDGTLNRTLNVSSSPHILTVTPEQNRNYSINSISNSCGVGYGNGNITVNVDNSTTLTLPSPSTTNICAGGTIEIPYNTVGTWASSRSLYMWLEDANGNYISNSSFFSYSESPIRYPIPSNLPLNGVYKVRMNVVLPIVTSSMLSSYSLTVTNTGCIPNAYIQSSSNDGCKFVYLNAYPSISGNSYQWYLNGNIVNGATSSSILATLTGNYSVQIINNQNGYNSTSIPLAVTVNMPTININSSGSLCDNGSSITIATSVSNQGYGYQWFYSANNQNFSLISGQSGSSITVSNPGSYYGVVTSGNCEQKTSTISTCPILVNFQSTTVCSLSSVSVPLTFFNYSQSETFTLQLIDAATGNVLLNNLATILGTQIVNGNYVASVNLPAEIGAGTYKFKLLSNSFQGGATGTGTLTVTSSTAPNPPTLTATPSSVTTTGQTVVLTASGCNGLVVWSNGITATSQNIVVNASSTYTAFCLSNGCSGQIANLPVSLVCDPLEPNNTFIQPTIVTSNNYLSQTICLDSGLDKDWFAWVYNGKVYYIMIRPFSSGSIGYYKFSLSLTNGILKLETLASTVGQNLDTYLFLYDSDGLSILSSDDDSGDLNYSLLNYTLPNPCPSQMVLTSALFDILEGQTSSSKASIINATNKINNNTLVNYRGQNAIILNPGFETKITSTGNFIAEIKGCNDN